jgi:DNA/RNA-binding domain of Phe-tRNA-synthetase-like protein
MADTQSLVELVEVAAEALERRGGHGNEREAAALRKAAARLSEQEGVIEEYRKALELIAVDPKTPVSAKLACSIAHAALRAAPAGKNDG